MKKTVSIDGRKYHVTVTHQPDKLFPFRYVVEVKYDGEFVGGRVFDNAGKHTLVELVKDFVQKINITVKNEEERKEAIKRFKEEFEEWNGVIES